MGTKIFAVLLLTSSLSVLSMENDGWDNPDCSFENFIINKKQICAPQKEMDFYPEEMTVIETEIVSERSGRMPEVRKPRQYQDSLYGPVFRSVSPFDGYDVWRYVTFFNTTSSERQSREFPKMYEECHDSFRFSNYSESLKVSLQLEAGIGIDVLGLKLRVGVEKTVSVTRNLNGVINEEAVHVPYIISERWRGRTFIQTYNYRTRKSNLKSIPRSNFDARNIDPIVRVKREDVRACSTDLSPPPKY